MCKDRIWILLTRKLSGEATLTEVEELNALVSQLPEGSRSIDEITGIWNSSPIHDEDFMEATYLAHLERMKAIGVTMDNDQVDNETVKNSRKLFSLKNISLLLIAGICVAAGWFLLPFKNAKAEDTARFAVNEIKTPRGARTKINLPDGSIVWLNAGSKLSYNKDFGNIKREVHLSGEGYFDVVKMNNKPFIIHTSNMDIKVLGTIFNVKAYPEEKHSETSLIKGRVEVILKNRTGSTIVLSPNEKLVVEDEPLTLNATKGKVIASLPVFSIRSLKINPEEEYVAEAQWINNRLLFNDESLQDVALKMQRWYNVLIEIKDPALAQKRFTGNFEKEGIYQALDALKITTPFEYTITGEKIIIDN